VIVGRAKLRKGRTSDAPAGIGAIADAESIADAEAETGEFI
jgi:hypothetical protein